MMKSKGTVLQEQRVADDIYFTYEEVHAVGYDQRLPPGTISVQRWKQKAWTRVPGDG
jgi:hypothetical protein